MDFIALKDRTDTFLVDLGEFDGGVNLGDTELDPLHVGGSFTNLSHRDLYKDSNALITGQTTAES